MNSGTLFAGNDGCTSITSGTRSMPATGAICAEIEIEPFVERRVEVVFAFDEENRVAIRRGGGDRLGRDVAGGAGPHLDDELLPKALPGKLPDEARGDVRRRTRRLPDDDAHRPRRIALRKARAGQRRGGGGARGEGQEARGGAAS